MVWEGQCKIGQISTSVQANNQIHRRETLGSMHGEGILQQKGAVIRNHTFLFIKQTARWLWYGHLLHDLFHVTETKIHTFSTSQFLRIFHSCLQRRLIDINHRDNSLWKGQRYCSGQVTPTTSNINNVVRFAPLYRKQMFNTLHHTSHLWDLLACKVFSTRKCFLVVWNLIVRIFWNVHQLGYIVFVCIFSVDCFDLRFIIVRVRLLLRRPSNHLWFHPFPIYTQTTFLLITSPFKFLYEKPFLWSNERRPPSCWSVNCCPWPILQSPHQSSNS